MGPDLRAGQREGLPWEGWGDRAEWGFRKAGPRGQWPEGAGLLRPDSPFWDPLVALLPGVTVTDGENGGQKQRPGGIQPALQDRLWSQARGPAPPGRWVALWVGLGCEGMGVKRPLGHAPAAPEVVSGQRGWRRWRRR